MAVCLVFDVHSITDALLAISTAARVSAIRPIQNCIFSLFWYTLIVEWKRTAFDWNQARAFLVTAEEGSLSAAARALGLTQPTLSRQVAGIEETLGVTLFERTARALLLTQAGMELLEHFRSMGSAADRISIAATGQSQTLSGNVVVSATNMLATFYLPSIFKDLRVKAPELKIGVITSNQLSNLLRREADIAIRHARPQDENLIAKRLRDASAYLYASPSYIREVGRPSKASELSNMRFVGVENPEALLGILGSRGLDLTTANFNFSTAQGSLALELVRNGLGISIFPSEIAERYPELENFLPEFEPIHIETWLVAHRELRTNPSIRLVFDLISDSLGKNDEAIVMD